MLKRVENIIRCKLRIVEGVDNRSTESAAHSSFILKIENMQRLAGLGVHGYKGGA